jgi:hypothetical protein
MNAALSALPAPFSPGLFFDHLRARLQAVYADLTPYAANDLSPA